MTEVTAKMVSDLRARTGVAMMECKKALVAANGEMDLAIEALRKAGQAKAVKKGDRIAAEGLVAVAVNSANTVAAIAEVNCETDFVARESRFKDFTQQVIKSALSNNSTAIESFEPARLELVTQLGENIAVRRINLLQAENGGVVAAYLHGGETGSSQIASIVALNVDNLSLAKDIAMHIAAMKPEYLSEQQVPADRIAKEKEILMAQSEEANAGKPIDIQEKIAAGKISKFLKEITLLGQPFVKNPDQTVGALLDTAKAKVTGYVRFEVGEGIEKKVTDFVGEVMSQVKG